MREGGKSKEGTARGYNPVYSFLSLSFGPLCLNKNNSFSDESSPRRHCSSCRFKLFTIRKQFAVNHLVKGKLSGYPLTSSSFSLHNLGAKWLQKRIHFIMYGLLFILYVFYSLEYSAAAAAAATAITAKSKSSF